MRSVLILRAGTGSSDILERDLKKAGLHVLGASPCEELVRDTMRWKPDVVVARESAASPALFAATALLQSACPAAVAVFTDDIRVETMEQALASGIHAWVVRGYGAERLRATLQLALVRYARDKLQREALASLSGKLAERKLVDRAKGILMHAGPMAEDEAFRRLRAAAMEGKERLGQVAQRLIEAARNAEAMNRAGQLRMLSQRLVKLHLLENLDVDAQSAHALQVVSGERLRQNFAVLSELLSRATFGDLLDACQEAWRALEPSLAVPGLSRGSEGADAQAEALLDAAERLTGALEMASPVARMHVVNLAGRQRMLSQRFAKLALQHGAAPEPGRPALATALAACRGAFEAALADLEKSPLTTARGLAQLNAAAHAWQVLRSAAAAADSPAGRLAIAQSSEELLEHFEQLTEHYEHSLQVLVG
jgi:AmiR/NasT family two-component response regulator